MNDSDNLNLIDINSVLNICEDMVERFLINNFCVVVSHHDVGNNESNL